MSELEQRDIMLMGRVAAGDGGAFRELFDRHSPVILGMLTRMLRRRETAEEVLQEAFLKAWRRADSYRPERAAPRAWLVTLARSTAIDRIRSGSARGRREESWVRADPEADAATPVGTSRLEAGELQQATRAALERLPEEQRRCIELAFFGGLTHRQVAEHVAAPLGTVKSRILLGMRKLRDELEELRAR